MRVGHHSCRPNPKRSSLLCPSLLIAPPVIEELDEFVEASSLGPIAWCAPEISLNCLIRAMFEKQTHDVGVPLADGVVKRSNAVFALNIRVGSTSQ